MPHTHRISTPVSTLGKSILLGAGLLLAGCSTLDKVTGIFVSDTPTLGTEGTVKGYLGQVVSDEPQAALAGRNILSSGGNAVDAMVAVTSTLWVSLSSRAGIGGGGECVVFPAKGVSGPQAFSFPAGSPRSLSGDRPAGVPMMARGLFLMHARFGALKFEQLIAPAEAQARFGVAVSRAFARDLAVVGQALAADPIAASLYFRNGLPVAEGTNIIQTELAATLGQLRSAGVGDFYQGAFARRLADGSQSVGANISLEDLRTALPKQDPPLLVASRFNGDQVAFTAGPGGAAAAAAFQLLARDPQAVVQDGVGALPASSSAVTLDNAGNAVACAFSLNNLFGTGRIVPGTGVLLAAAPGPSSTPLLSAAIAFNPALKVFRAAVGGSGQQGAARATASAMAQTLATGQALPALPAEPGRANVIGCSRYLPRSEESCMAATDPRGAGLSAGSN
jgi:gamma-glutamyltranspeptidase/glutathione hydrolase